MPAQPHLGAVTGAVDGDGALQAGRGRPQRLARVRDDQLAQLARVAERDGAQAVLHALGLRHEPERARGQAPALPLWGACTLHLGHTARTPPARGPARPCLS